MLMHSHPQLLFSIVVVEVFSTDERLANGATGHNPAVLEAEGREEVLMMMMSFICSFRNKNEPKAIYPPSEVLSTTEERGTCDDASTMTLVVQWWFFVPFGKRGRVLHPLPVNHPQCPFIQMTDTDVTFLSCYNTVGHTRMHVMTLTSHPTLSLSRPWAGWSMRQFTPSHLLIQGSSLLSFLPYSLSVFWMHAKN